jgi:hypothetical protein
MAAAELTFPIALLTSTLAYGHFESTSCRPVEVPLDYAADLASLWTGGPYVAVASQAGGFDRFGRSAATSRYVFVIEAFIIEEVLIALDAVQDLIRAGHWKPPDGRAVFRLSDGALEPLDLVTRTASSYGILVAALRQGVV